MSKSDTKAKVRAYSKHLKGRTRERLVSSEKLVSKLSAKIDDLSDRIDSLSRLIGKLVAK